MVYSNMLKIKGYILTVPSVPRFCPMLQEDPKRVDRRSGQITYERLIG